MIHSFSPRRTIHVEARSHTSFEVERGNCVRFTDLEGAQPIDLWVFSKGNIFEHLSCEHTKPAIEKLCPVVGDSAYTNQRNPIVTLIEDNSPGQHDMQFAACDVTRYRDLGWDAHKDGYHANCQDNLHKGLHDLGLELPYTPQPWNLFTNFYLHRDGTFEVRSPATQAGDNMTLLIEMDAYVVVSACPQDMNATCGNNPSPLKVQLG